MSILPPDVPGALAGAAVVTIVDGLADLVVEVHLVLGKPWNLEDDGWWRSSPDECQ